MTNWILGMGNWNGVNVVNWSDNAWWPVEAKWSGGLSE